MPAPKLFDLALKRCIQSHQRLESVGDLPYSIVKPILIRVDNAKQLYEIERNSPQIRGDDADLWQALIKRDVPKPIRDAYDYEPKDPAEWYHVYVSLKKKRDKKAAEAVAAIKGNLSNAVQAKQGNVVREMKGIHKERPKRAWGGISSAPKRKTDAGKGLLNKFRGELRSKPAPKVIINPRKQTVHPSVVSKAPAGMVQDYAVAKKAARPQGPSEISKLQAGASRGLGRPKPRLDTSEQRRLSEADSTNTITDKPVPATKKRPAPPPSSKPINSIFMAPKRRKIG